MIRNLKVDKDHASLPAIEELYEEILRGFGGKQKFAETLVEDFNAAARGSQTRVRLLQSILDGMKILADRGKLDTGDADAAAMDDAELDAYIRRIVKETMQKTDG